jgi:hypothetical protein
LAVFEAVEDLRDIRVEGDGFIVSIVSDGSNRGRLVEDGVEFGRGFEWGSDVGVDPERPSSVSGEEA